MENVIPWEGVKIAPDFTLLKKYLNFGKDEKEFKRFVKAYHKSDSVTHIPFLSQSEGDTLLDGLVLVINKYPLQGHEVNISYLVMELYHYTFRKWTEFRVPAQHSKAKVEEFKALIDYLLKHRSDNLKILFDISIVTPRKKPKIMPNPQYNMISCADPSITKWLADCALSAVANGNYPIMGHQLFQSVMVSDIDTKQQYLKLHPNAYFEEASAETLKTDAIMEVCIPILNYLQTETEIKKGKGKHWSAEQLGFLVDVLILIRYYTSTHRNYKIGVSSPSTQDKKYLDSTLSNKLKQGKLQTINTIQG